MKTFSGETLQFRESGRPQRARGEITVCRFMVFYAGRWRRLYSNHAPGLEYPHFIVVNNSRMLIKDVAP